MKVRAFRVALLIAAGFVAVLLCWPKANQVLGQRFYCTDVEFDYSTARVRYRNYRFYFLASERVESTWMTRELLRLKLEGGAERWVAAGSWGVDHAQLEKTSTGRILSYVLSFGRLWEAIHQKQRQDASDSLLREFVEAMRVEDAKHMLRLEQELLNGSEFR